MVEIPITLDRDRELSLRFLERVPSIDGIAAMFAAYGVYPSRTPCFPYDRFEGVRLVLDRKHLVATYSDPGRGVEEGKLYAWIMAPEVLLCIERYADRFGVELVRFWDAEYHVVYRGRDYNLSNADYGYWCWVHPGVVRPLDEIASTWCGARDETLGIDLVKREIRRWATLILLAFENPAGSPEAMLNLWSYGGKLIVRFVRISSNRIWGWVGGDGCYGTTLNDPGLAKRQHPITKTWESTTAVPGSQRGHESFPIPF